METSRSLGFISIPGQQDSTFKNKVDDACGTLPVRVLFTNTCMRTHQATTPERKYRLCVSPRWSVRCISEEIHYPFCSVGEVMGSFAISTGSFKWVVCYNSVLVFVCLAFVLTCNLFCLWKSKFDRRWVLTSLVRQAWKCFKKKNYWVQNYVFQMRAIVASRKCGNLHFH